MKIALHLGHCLHWKLSDKSLQSPLTLANLRAKIFMWKDGHECLVWPLGTVLVESALTWSFTFWLRFPLRGYLPSAHLSRPVPV